MSTAVDKHLPGRLEGQGLWPLDNKTPPDNWNIRISTFCYRRHIFYKEDHGLMEVATVLKVVSESIGFETADVA